MLTFRALFLVGSLFLGAAMPFTERTKTDFDSFLQLLNPYGRWVKQTETWLYEPFEAYVPMTDGQWVYSDFGWYWLGKRPFSWATDHYGTWVLGQDSVWRWKPDPNWQPARVEWRGTTEYIGWRPTVINRFGELTEPETARYARPEEWIFIPRAKLTQTITAADAVTGDKAKPIVEQSEGISHTYVTWREIDRSGPDPYDVYGVAKSFLAQQTMAPAPTQVLDLSGGEGASPIIVAAPAPTGPAAADPEKEKKPPIHVIMSLPDFYYAVKPNPLKPLDLYVYRPEIFQDTEGIQRRVDIWHNPPARQANREKVARVLEHGTLIIDGKTPPPAATASVPIATSSAPVTATTSTPDTTTSSAPAKSPTSSKR